MIKLKTTLILGVILTAGIPGAWAQRIHSNAGTSSADFLKIGVGARPIGMGEAFTAVADDVNAVYWNPAGLAGQSYRNIGVSHNESFQGLRHEFVGYNSPLNIGRAKGAAWGLGLISLSVPNNIERRSGLNENDPFNPITAPEGTFGASDLALGASCAQRWNERHAFGATFKYIRQTIDSQSGDTFGLDLGWKYHSGIRGLDLGAVIQNLGPGVAIASRYPLPRTLKLGASYWWHASNRLALDASFPRDDFPTLATGVEMPMNKYFNLRGGYSYRWYGNPLGVVSGFRTGVGFMYENLTLDYAFAPFGDLGNTHRISLGWRFGSSKPAAAQTAAVAPAVAAPVEVVRSSVAPTAQSAALREAAASTAAIISAARVTPPAPKNGMSYTNFELMVLPKVVSARGVDYLVHAEAPGPEWSLRAIDFRSLLMTTQGLLVQVVPQDLKQPLPKQYQLVQAYHMHLSQTIPARSISMEFSPKTAGLNSVILGLVSGEWKPLPMKTVSAGNQTVIRAATDVFVEDIAIATDASSPRQ